MTKKMNQESSHGDKSYSDPEDDDSSAEQTRRDDERGRTVLAKVGKAIQNGNKITLELHPVYQVPCGDNRKTLSTYIGVVVRERVNITYKKWRNVPREVVNEVYEFIGKGFDIPSISKSWILRRASIRFRAFKTRLRKFWVYKSSGKIRKTVPWKYPWISQVDWDKFIEYCTSPEYQELSKKSKERSLQKKTSYRGGCRGYLYYEEQIIKELEKQKIHVTQVPRHLVWLKAHATEEDGKLMFKNPVDLEIAKAIKALEAQYERGEIFTKGRNDILAKAINKPEHGGRVRGVGSGVTNKQYFGFNQPTPPNQLRSELFHMKKEMENMKNSQNLMMSFIMSSSSINQEQLRQLMSNLGNSSCSPLDENLRGCQGLDGSRFGGFSGQHSGFDKQFCSSGYQGLENARVGGFIGLLNGYGDQGLGDAHLGDFVLASQPRQEDIDPYHVAWPEQPQSRDDHINNYTFPEGWSPCSLAIQGDKGIQIVATGEVEVTSEVIHIHNVRVGNGFRRVKVLEEIVSSAELPCPTEEFTFVCQAMKSFVPWPVHLIFPKAEGDKHQSPPFATPSPQTPSSSQASNNKKYVITDKDQAKLTTSLLRNFKRDAMKMKLKDAFISITIPPNVYGHQHIVSIDYEDMLDWCFQRELGANHMSIFMKYLSEKCQGESISGMYGFCDFNYLSPLTPINDDEERVDYLARVFAQNDGRNINQLFFAPYHENRHWMLAVISPWNGTVFWLDPAGAENDIREFAQTIINDGIKRFSFKYRTDIKKLKKNPKIKWNKPECPRQTKDSVDCGYYICRYMLETIEKRRQGIPEQYFGGAPTAYSEMKIDELRDMWIKFVQEYKLEDEEG